MFRYKCAVLLTLLEVSLAEGKCDTYCVFVQDKILECL